jgi:hypothetical protein
MRKLVVVGMMLSGCLFPRIDVVDSFGNGGSSGDASGGGGSAGSGVSAPEGGNDDPGVGGTTTGGAPNGGSKPNGGTTTTGGVSTGGGGEDGHGAASGESGGGAPPDDPEPDPSLGPIGVASGLMAPSGIALDASKVYFTDHDAGTILSCPLAGCGDEPPTVIASGLFEPRKLDVDATHVYWIQGPRNEDGVTASRLYKCPLVGCTSGTIEKLADVTGSAQAYDVHLLDGLLYVAAWPALSSCPTSGCVAGGMTKVDTGPYVAVDSHDGLLYGSRYGWGEFVRCSPLNCTPTAEILNEPFAASGAAIDATHLYLTRSELSYDSTVSSTGTIVRCPHEGCGADPGEPFQSGEISPAAVAVGAKRVYYTNFHHGTVVSVPK